MKPLAARESGAQGCGCPGAGWAERCLAVGVAWRLRERFMGPNGVASHLLVLFQATCMPRHSRFSISAGELLQHIGPPAALSRPQALLACGGL